MGNPDMATPPHVVEKLVEAARKPKNHRYSVSRGIYKLRVAICEWYQRRYDVELDPDTEAIVTIGSKEGLGHLALAMLGPGDVVFCPTRRTRSTSTPVIIAGGDLRTIPLMPGADFLANLETRSHAPGRSRSSSSSTSRTTRPPRSSTSAFFERLVAFAREHDALVVHDLAYADLCFDGYKPPSILEVPGAKDVAIEFFSLSKSYTCRLAHRLRVREPRDGAALARIKSYLDYGMPQPIQIGGDRTRCAGRRTT